MSNIQFTVVNNSRMKTTKNSKGGTRDENLIDIGGIKLELSTAPYGAYWLATISNALL